MAVVIWDNRLGGPCCPASSPNVVPHDDALMSEREGLFMAATAGAETRGGTKNGNTHGRDGEWLQRTVWLREGA